MIRTFKRGAHVPDMKKITAYKAVINMPAPENLYIGLAQHIGKPAVPTVEAGADVKRGQLIARADGAVSANIHSSVSGRVGGIVKMRNAQGVAADYIHIINDFKYDTVFLDPIKPDKDSILTRIKEAGIVGMGGAGFPTAIKLSPKDKVDTLIINGAECEPYLNCDNRTMIERGKQVFLGIMYMAQVLGVTPENVFIGIETNKMAAVMSMRRAGAQVVPLKRKYPQGAEKQLIYAITRRKVRMGALPSSVGCVVQNIQTAYAVYEAVDKGKPLYERVMTVAGKGVAKPKNIRFAIGTRHADILSFCGGISQDAVKLISGGPMMGFALADTGAAAGKTDGGLIALTADEAAVESPKPCIKCCTCVKSCPMHLMPLYIDFFTLAGDYETAIKYGVKDCIECGVCSYSCPACRTLTQSFKLAKAKVRELKL